MARGGRSKVEDGTGSTQPLERVWHGLARVSRLLCDFAQLTSLSLISLKDKMDLRLVPCAVIAVCNETIEGKPL